MKRDLYSELENWKDSEQRKPLYLTGIRQCGKTWLAREFANNCFENCLYIDLMKKENQLLFQESDSPKALIDRLSFLFSQTIQPEKTLLIFDHQPTAPFASSLLSEFYFQAKRYAVMILDHQYGTELDERRSLNETNTKRLILKPLSFLEFLKAVGKDNLVVYLQNLNTLDPLFMPFYQDLLDLLNLYFHTGGFPQAIACWLETEDLKKVQKIQDDILRQITLDFFEKDSTLGFKARNIWSWLPAILQKPNNKFTYRNIDL